MVKYKSIKQKKSTQKDGKLEFSKNNKDNLPLKSELKKYFVCLIQAKLFS